MQWGAERIGHRPPLPYGAPAEAPRTFSCLKPAGMVDLLPRRQAFVSAGGETQTARPAEVSSSNFRRAGGDPR